MDDRFINTNWDEEYLTIKDSLIVKYAEILKTKQGEAKYKYSDSKTIFTDEIIDLLDKESEAIRGKKYITPSQPSHCEFKETLFYTFQDRYDGHFKKGYEIDEFLVLTVEKIRKEKIKEFHTSGESHRKAYFNDVRFLEEAQSEEIFQLVAKLDVIRLIMDRSPGYELYQSTVAPSFEELPENQNSSVQMDELISIEDIFSDKSIWTKLRSFLEQKTICILEPSSDNPKLIKRINSKKDLNYIIKYLEKQNYFIQLKTSREEYIANHFSRLIDGYKVTGRTLQNHATYIPDFEPTLKLKFAH